MLSGYECPNCYGINGLHSGMDTCPPNPKELDDLCTCIQDESRDWINCPVHGKYWKDRKMVIANSDVIWSQKAHDKKMAQVSATFEVFPHLMGFNDNVILRAVKVDYSRNIVSFYFGGDGLEEIENQIHVDLTHREGQECPEIIPPVLA